MTRHHLPSQPEKQPLKDAITEAHTQGLDLDEAELDRRGATLFKRAIIITGTDEGTLRGDLLLRDGRIVAVAPDLVVDDAEIVDASRYIVCAGFIDTHHHLWQSMFKGFAIDTGLLDVFDTVYGAYAPRFAASDIHAATLLARLTGLNAGVTTVVNWANNAATPEIEDAGIQALRDAGGRSVFGHGFREDRTTPAGIERYHDQPRPIEAAQRIRTVLPDDDALVSSCYLGIEPGHLISMDACKKELAIARELGMRTSMHINSMGAGPALVDTLTAMHAEGILGEDLTFVHLNGATDQGLRAIADTGGSASVSAQIASHLPGMTPPQTGRLVAAGVRPSLSLDSALVGSEDFFSQMRTAFDVERALVKVGAHPDLGLTLNDIFEFATLRGAHAIGQVQRLGSVAVGKQADLIFIDTTSLNMSPVLDPLAAVVFHASIRDVDTVLVGGTAVKRGGRLLADLTQLRRQVENIVDRLYWHSEVQLPANAMRPHPATEPPVDR